MQQLSVETESRSFQTFEASLKKNTNTCTFQPQSRFDFGCEGDSLTVFWRSHLQGLGGSARSFLIKKRVLMSRQLFFFISASPPYYSALNWTGGQLTRRPARRCPAPAALTFHPLVSELSRLKLHTAERSSAFGI